MKKTISVFVLSIGILFTTNQAHAILIVDTGMPPDSSGGLSLNNQQFLSGKFSISEAYSIVSVQGWLNTIQQGYVSLNLYEDNGITDISGGPIPDTSSILFSATFLPSSATGWQGESGLNWNLNPGSYWIEFAVDSLPSYIGFMPGDPPGPLDNYAFFEVDENLYRGTSSNFGVRIDANVIPEPTTLLLFGSGLVGACFRRKQKKLSDSPKGWMQH